MRRGNRRERIYRDDEDRKFSLKILAEACEMTGWRIHAWVLMGNSYHLLIQTPEVNLWPG
jgi:putative transposase